jgi:hypothetical protein
VHARKQREPVLGVVRDTDPWNELRQRCLSGDVQKAIGATVFDVFDTKTGSDSKRAEAEPVLNKAGISLIAAFVVLNYYAVSRCWPIAVLLKTFLVFEVNAKSGFQFIAPPKEGLRYSQPRLQAREDVSTQPPLIPASRV